MYSSDLYLLSIKYGAIGADSRIMHMRMMIHFFGLYHAAQAGTHATGHMLFQRDIGLDFFFFRLFYDRTEHGHRSAREDHICLQCIFFDGIHDIALRADTAILGGNIYGSVLFQILF